MKQIHWFWCWLCFRTYLALPMPRTHKSVYGRLSLWILGFAGFYAHTPRPSRSPESTQETASE
jgi:hypothetical protein